MYIIIYIHVYVDIHTYTPTRRTTHKECGLQRGMGLPPVLRCREERSPRAEALGVVGAVVKEVFNVGPKAVAKIIQPPASNTPSTAAIEMTVRSTAPRRNHAHLCAFTRWEALRELRTWRFLGLGHQRRVPLAFCLDMYTCIVAYLDTNTPAYMYKMYMCVYMYLVFLCVLSILTSQVEALSMRSSWQRSKRLSTSPRAGIGLYGII